MMNHLSNNMYVSIILSVLPYVSRHAVLVSIAGSDTTAVSLHACFCYLIKTIKTYANLIEEIDQADAQDTLPQDMLSKYIPYAECLALPYL
jgi:cytochrome P450